MSGVRLRNAVMAGVSALVFGTIGVHAQETDTSTEDSERYDIEEVMVTATRREVNVNETPISIAVLGADEIDRRQISEMNDYLRTVPSVNFVDLGVGRNSIIMRGLSLSQSSVGTVGIYFGDVPLQGMGPGAADPDIRMVDLERVEVLRGPQGTLFGSNTLAGAVRNIPKAPNLSEFEGRVKGSFSNTDKYGGNNTKIEGVINVPLIKDTLAMRAVAYSHDISGFIKNIAATQLQNGGQGRPGVLASADANRWQAWELYQDEDNVGHSTYKGGRVALEWLATEDLSFTLQYLYHKTDQEGMPYAQANLPPYTQVSLQFGNDVPALQGQSEGGRDELQITNLVVEYDTDWGQFFSSTAYLENDSRWLYEGHVFGEGSGFAQRYDYIDESFIQEVRFVSEFDGPFNFVAGLYYDDVESHEDKDSTDNNPNQAISYFGLFRPPNPFPGPNPYGATPRTVAFDITELEDSQTAFYGEASFDITEKWIVTGGARYYKYERSLYRLLNQSGGSQLTDETDEDSGTNLKLNVSYLPDDDTMWYAQWAEGFRLGGAQPLPFEHQCDVNHDDILDGTNAPIRNGYGSDSIDTYEIGFKSGLFDNRMQFNAAAFYSDWKDIPLSVVGGPLTPGGVRLCFARTTINAGSAISQGVEFETTFQATDQLSLRFGGAFVNAELSEPFPQGGGNDGDRLPYSPEITLNGSLIYDFSMFGKSSFVSTDIGYVGESYNRLNEQGDKLGDYVEVGANLTVNVTDLVALELFGQNLTNSDAITASDIVIIGARIFPLRPRTIGVAVTVDF
jgi:iron complex outermembrane receptor protein